MGISGMGIYEGVSPYSVLDKLGKVLPGTLDAMKAKQQAWQVCIMFPSVVIFPYQLLTSRTQSKFASIKDLLQTDKVAFFVHRASTETNVDVDERPEMANEPPQVLFSFV